MGMKTWHELMARQSSPKTPKRVCQLRYFVDALQYPQLVELVILPVSILKIPQAKLYFAVHLFTRVSLHSLFCLLVWELLC
jgi:hypothetical protein